MEKGIKDEPDEAQWAYVQVIPKLVVTASHNHSVPEAGLW